MALAYHHVTPAGAGLKDGSSWANAMGEAEFETDLEGSAAGDDVYFVQAGTYTLDSAYDASARDGTATAPVVIIGVKAATTHEGAAVVLSDWGTGTDRPLFSAGTNAITFGDYYKVFNCRFQGSAATLITGGSYTFFFQCYFENNYGSSASRNSVSIGSYGAVISSEITSANARGVFGAAYSKTLFCYIHDIPDSTNGVGYVVSGISGVVAFCVFDNCATGVLATADHALLILNNTFYGGGTGISLTTDTAWVGINNIFEGMSTDAVKQTTRTDSNFWWQNHGSDARCGDMWDGVDDTTLHQDYAVTSGDPVFTTPGSNFSLQSTSPNLNAGLSIALGVG